MSTVELEARLPAAATRYRIRGWTSAFPVGRHSRRSRRPLCSAAPGLARPWPFPVAQSHARSCPAVRFASQSKRLSVAAKRRVLWRPRGRSGLEVRHAAATRAGGSARIACRARRFAFDSALEARCEDCWLSERSRSQPRGRRYRSARAATTLKGEVVDCIAPEGHQAQGTDHADCALSCAARRDDGLLRPTACTRHGRTTRRRIQEAIESSQGGEATGEVTEKDARSSSS